jgi:ribonuclease-3
MEATEAAFRPILSTHVAPASKGDAPKSAKSRLQEWSQRHRGTRPAYELVAAKGPAHAQHFTVEVVVGAERLAQGSGSSRQRAEEHAAQAALDHLPEVGA